MHYLVEIPSTKKTLEVDLDETKKLECAVNDTYSDYTMTIIVPFRANYKKNKKDQRNVHLRKFKK